MGRCYVRFSYLLTTIPFFYQHLSEVLFITKILSRIRLLNQYEESDIDVIRYSLEAILWEIEKTVVMFLAFAILGYLNYFLVLLLVTFSIRPLAGGYHSQTALGCLVITFSGLFLSITILSNLIVNNIVILILSLFSFITTVLLAPMNSIERASIQKIDKNKQKKVLVSIITLTWLVLIFINRTNTYIYSMLWLIVFQNIQLLLEYMRRKRNKIC